MLIGRQVSVGIPSDDRATAFVMDRGEMLGHLAWRRNTIVEPPTTPEKMLMRVKSIIADRPSLESFEDGDTVNDSAVVDQVILFCQLARTAQDAALLAHQRALHEDGLPDNGRHWDSVGDDCNDAAYEALLVAGEYLDFVRTGTKPQGAL